MSSGSCQWLFIMPPETSSTDVSDIYVCVATYIQYYQILNRTFALSHDPYTVNNLLVMQSQGW